MEFSDRDDELISGPEELGKSRTENLFPDSNEQSESPAFPPPEHKEQQHSSMFPPPEHQEQAQSPAFPPPEHQEYPQTSAFPLSEHHEQPESSVFPPAEHQEQTQSSMFPPADDRGPESHRNSRDESAKKGSPLLRIGLGILACVVIVGLGFAIANMLSGSDSVDNAAEELAEPNFDSETESETSPNAESSVEDVAEQPVETVPEVVLEPVVRRCVVELADQPIEADFVVGESPTECPDLAVLNQYESYTAGDLAPWTEGVEQCWAGADLVQLWVGFNVSESQKGWLPLTPETKTSYFQEGLAEGELFATANTNSVSIGTFGYADLSGKVFAVQLDLPATITPTVEDKTHLGGCWQTDRDDERGLHFYWPTGVDI